MLVYRCENEFGVRMNSVLVCIKLRQIMKFVNLIFL